MLLLFWLLLHPLILPAWLFAMRAAGHIYDAETVHGLSRSARIVYLAGAALLLILDLIRLFA